MCKFVCRINFRGQSGWVKWFVHLKFLIDFAKLPSTGRVLIFFPTSNLSLTNSNMLGYLLEPQIVMPKAYSVCRSESSIGTVAELPSSAGDPLSPDCV